MNAENKETYKKHDAGSCCSEQYAVPSELPLPLCSGSRYISSELACRTAAADYIILISADAVCNCKGNSASLPSHRLLRPSTRTFVSNICSAYIPHYIEHIFECQRKRQTFSNIFSVFCVIRAVQAGNTRSEYTFAFSPSSTYTENIMWVCSAEHGLKSSSGPAGQFPGLRAIQRYFYGKRTNHGKAAADS